MVELRNDYGMVGQWSKIEASCSEKSFNLGGWWAVGLILKIPSFQIDCVMVQLRHDYGMVGQW